MLSARRIRTTSNMCSPSVNPKACRVFASAGITAELINLVPAVKPCPLSNEGTPTICERSRSIFSGEINVPPPRPGKRRTTPVSSSAVSASRRVERLTWYSLAKSRSAPNFCPARNWPELICAKMRCRTSSAVRPKSSFALTTQQ